MGAPRDRRELGRLGEELASAYLEERGYEVVARNWRSRRGELDIVARKGRLTAFVEVKTRTGDTFGAPEEAVTPAKAGRIRSLAGEYLASHGGTPDVRFDVIGVLLAPGEEPASIDHITGAF